MSIKIMNEVWEIGGLDPTSKLILMCIADMADEETRIAWPSIPTLARKTCVSERSVQRHIRNLQDIGLLNVEKRHLQSSIYEILRGGDNLSPVTRASPGGDTGVTRVVTRASPRTVNRTINEPSDFPRARARKKKTGWVEPRRSGDAAIAAIERIERRQEDDRRREEEGGAIASADVQRLPDKRSG